MHAHILYFNFLMPDGEGMSIGGIQTYIANLIPVLKKCGYEATVYQLSSADFHKQLVNCDVYGIGSQLRPCAKAAELLLDKVEEKIDKSNDLLIYGCESCITRKVNYRTIAIQHGVAWDIPYPKSSRLRYIRNFIGKCRLTWAISERVSKVDTLVCVDYNFLNLLRAICPYITTRLVVIPNFSDLPSSMPLKENRTVNIIFARRFFPHRGTRLFTSVAERLLAKYNYLKITVAGDGPDAYYMKNRLEKYSSVKFITYESKDSPFIHKDQDIAVVPTLGSEGTSLSLLEAMASGCAVVCTNVGGMTNIVLDGYNGMMTNPDEHCIYNAIVKLIDDPALMKTIQKNAFDTVKQAFSLEKWTNKWCDVIKAAR